MKVGDKLIHKTTNDVFRITIIGDCPWKKCQTPTLVCKHDNVCPGYINTKCFGVEKDFLVKLYEVDSLEEVIEAEINRLKGGVR